MKLIWVEKKQRKAVFRFYKRFMPYARISQKEQVALLINHPETFSPDQTIQADQIIAGLRLRPIGEFDLLLGMLVQPDQRGQGVGNQLMSAVSDKLISEKTYLFALPHLVEFYQQHGFDNTSQAPNDIEQLYEKYTSQGKELVMMGYQMPKALL